MYYLLGTEVNIMNKSIFALSLGAVIAGAVLFYPKTASANWTPGPNYTQERHEAMEKAFATNDYNAWKKLMDGRGRVTQVINKDNFAKFAQAHTLDEQGRIKEAEKIRQELGLRLRNGSRFGFGRRNK